MSGEEFEARICTRCHSGLFYPHDEFHEWEKCELCGYCRLKNGK